MNARKISNLDKFSQALLRLSEALQVPSSNELAIDGTIQRFEFCFELAWKAMKDQLAAHKGIDVPFPKPALQEAYKAGWIADEKLWLSMLSDRNNSSHTYNLDLAKAIYERIRAMYLSELDRVCRLLKEQPHA